MGLKNKRIVLKSGDASACGKIVAEDILGKYNLLAVKKGTELTESLIDWLIGRGHTHIWIEDENAQQADGSDSYKASVNLQKSGISQEALAAFDDERNKSVVKSKEQLTGISRGEQADVDRLHQMSENVIDKLKSRNDVLRYIRYLESDGDMYSHSLNVAMLCNLFAYWIGMTEEEIALLTTAGALHDIGKIRVPSNVLNKRGTLTAQEFEQMKKHTIEGYDILKNQKLPEEVKLAALLHHERLAGTGYPYGYTGDQIPPYASIVAICDTYDAMISNRTYREMMSPFIAIQTFEQKMYSDLNTKYLLIFLKNIAHAFLNSRVLLSTGEEGEVVFIHEHNLSRPIVKCDSGFVDLNEVNDVDISQTY